MSRKEINIFSVSFLDLLSGALAAVIILFVVVPKMTQQQQESLRTIDSLQVQVDDLANIIKRARNAIPDSIYRQIVAQVKRMEQTIDSLRQQTNNLQRQLAECDEQNESLRGELQRTQKRLQQAERIVNEQQQNQVGPGEVIYGLNAQLGIVCKWEENIDVDLHVVNRTTNEVCSFRKKEFSWGNYLSDITSRGQNDKTYELFYQMQIVPGQYDIYLHLYSATGTAKVNGFIRYKPLTNQEIMIKFPNEYTLTNTGQKPPYPPQGGTKVGTLNITQNGITLN